jgi:hypothetical protein
MGRGDDDDDASLSSVSTKGPQATESSMRNLTVNDHRRSTSGISALSAGRSPRVSMDAKSMSSSRPLTPATPTSHEVKPLLSILCRC